MVNSQDHFFKKRILVSGLSFFLILILVILAFSGSLLLERCFPLAKELFYYVPPVDYLKLISGSFQSFCADFFYIRGVMAITDNIKEHSRWVDWVQNNFRAAIALDPDMLQAYFFAGIVVADNKEGLEKGIAFLKEGAQQNTKSWQILYWLGFNYYQAGDYLKSAEYYERASNLAGAPKFLKSIQPMQFYKARRADLGVAYLEGLLQSVKDPQQLEWIKLKLEWLKNIVILEKKVDQFVKIYGYSPDSLGDLLKMRLIDQIPVDPFGAGYYLDKESGRIKSKFGISGSKK